MADVTQDTARPCRNGDQNKEVPIRTDVRAVSPVAAYVLTLGITAVLIGGLFIAGGTFIDDQRQTTAESELQVLGQQVSADIAAADRLTRTDGETDVTIRRSLPDRVVGANYRISVRHDVEGPTNPYLVVIAEDLDVEVKIGLTSETSVTESTAHSGDVLIEYDESEGGLVIRNA